MSVNLNQVYELLGDMGRPLHPVMHSFDQQSLRILHRAAQAMACGPGGLRLKAGSRPWLDQLSTNPLASAAQVASRGAGSGLPAVGH